MYDENMHLFHGTSDVHNFDKIVIPEVNGKWDNMFGPGLYTSAVFSGAQNYASHASNPLIDGGVGCESDGTIYIFVVTPEGKERMRGIVASSMDGRSHYTEEQKRYILTHYDFIMNAEEVSHADFPTEIKFNKSAEPYLQKLTKFPAGINEHRDTNLCEKKIDETVFAGDRNLNVRRQALKKNHNLVCLDDDVPKNIDSMQGKLVDPAIVEDGMFKAMFDKDGKLACPTTSQYLKNKKVIDEFNRKVLDRLKGAERATYLAIKSTYLALKN